MYFESAVPHAADIDVPVILTDMSSSDPAFGAPRAGDKHSGPSGPGQSKPAGGSSKEHAPPSKRMRTRASACADLDDLQLEALRLHSFRAAFTGLQKPMSTIEWNFQSSISSSPGMLMSFLQYLRVLLLICPWHS